MKYLSLGLMLGFINVSVFAQASKMEELKSIIREPYVAPENIIVDQFEELGEIIGSFRQARYLTNEDTVYLSMSQAVSVGDRFSIYVDRGGVKVPGTWLSKQGRKIQLLGNLQVIDVTPKWVVAKISNANEDIIRGYKVGPLVDLSLVINPQEPKEMVRGQVLSAAQNSKMVGSFEFAFIDKGKADGLQINDRLYVYRQGDGLINSNSDYPEVPVAEIVVVHMDEHVSTVYTLSGHESFEGGAKFKSAISEERYLDSSLQGLSEQTPPLQ